MLAIGILFSDMLSSRLMTIIRLLEKPIYFLMVSLANVLLSITLNIYFIQSLGMGFNGALIALVCVSIIQLLLLLPLLAFNLKINQFDYALLRKMLLFSMPFLPASIFFIMIEMADRIMLGWLSSVEDVGLYGAGYKIGAIVLLIVRAFNLNWQPFYLKSEHNDSVIQFEQIGSRFIVFLIFISTIITMIWPILFKININNIYLIGEAFWSGGEIIPIIAFSYAIYGVFILQMPSIYIKNKQSWVPYFWGAGFIINFISNYLLIPGYGFYGAAFATFFAYLFMSLFLLYKNQDWLPIKYHLYDILYISIVSSIAFLAYLKLEFTLIIVIYVIIGALKIYKMQRA
jgi:O-antigen/teichoic acid export membrane protein